MASNEVKLRLSVDGAAQVVGGMNAVSSSMQTMEAAAGYAKAALVAFAGVASISAFKGMVQGSIEASAGLHDMAIQTGASVAALTAFRAVAATTSTSIEGVAGAMNRMAKGMAVANEDSKGIGQAVKALGVNFDNLRQMKPEDQMLAVAKAMDGFQDGAGKAAVAMALYGKEGAKMLPFMKDLADSSEEVSKKLTEQQIAAKAAQAAMADDYTDNLTKIQKASEAWKKDVSMAMLPALYELTQAFIDVNKGAGGIKKGISDLSADGSITNWARAAIFGVTYVMDGFEALKVVIQSVGKAVGANIAIMVENASMAWNVFTGLLGKEPVINIINASMARQKVIAQSLAEDLDKAWGNETFGKRLRDRMTEIQGVAVVAKKAKADLNFKTPDDKDGSEKISDYQKLTRVIAEKQAQDSLQLTTGRSLYESEKIRAKMIADLSTGTIKLSDIEKARINTGLEQLSVTEQLIAADKYYEEQQKARYAASSALVKAASDEADKNEELARTFGMSKAAIEALEIARLEEQVAQKTSINQCTEETAKLEALIAAKKRSAAALGSIEAQQATADAAKKAAAEWQKTADKINDAITEAFMSSFDKGKGFAQSLRDSVVGMFKSMAAVRIRAIIEPVGQSMASAIGFGGGGEGGGGGGSAIGVAQTLKSMYDVAVGGFAKFAATSGAAITDLGVKVGGTLIDLGAERAGTAVMEASTNATSVGTAGSVASIAAGVAIGVTVGKAISGGLGSNAAVNVGTAIGTAIAGPIGAVIGGVVGGIGNRLFGMGEIETRAQGIEGNFGGGSFTGNKFATYYQEGGFFRGDKNWTDRSSLDDKTTEQLSRGFALLQEASKTTAASLGLSAEAIVNYSQTVSLQLTNDAEANKATLTKLFTDMGDSMAKALVPNIEFFAKEGESASKTLSRLSTSLSTVNAWLGMMDHTLLELSLTGGEAASSLIDVFGGIDNFTNSSKAFYDTYYTDAEKIAASQDAMGKALALVNLALPTSKDAFKDLAKSLDLTTDYGQQAYAVLLAIAPEFATTADMMAKASASWGTAAQKINEAIEKEVNTVTTWTQKLAVLQGTVTERQLAMQADLATTANAATQELIKQVYAQEDLKTSTEALKEKTDALAATNKGWQDQLDVLTGAMTEHSIALRDAGDDSTRALMQQVYALQDAKVAADQATAAQAQYTAEVDKLTSALEQARSVVASTQSAVDSVRGEATNAYLSSLTAVASAQEALAKAQQDAQITLANIQIDAQIELANAANTAAKEMQDLGKQLREFIDGATLQPTAQFGKLLTAALGGDKAAMQALPGAANSAIDDAKLKATTGTAFALEKAGIVNRVAQVAAMAERLGQNTKAVPERLTAAALDAVAVATTELTLAQTRLADSLAVANAIGAPLTASVTDLIAKFQAAQGESIKAQQGLLAAQQALDAIRGNTAESLPKIDAVARAATEATVAATAAGVNVSGAVSAMQSVISNYLINGFSALDTSVNGLLSFEEFSQGFVGLATDAQLQTIFTELDANGDGQLSRLETIAANVNASTSAISAMQGVISSAIINNFAKLDTSVNGLLDYAEFAAGLQGLATDSQLKALFTEIDSNGDGQISKLEAIRLAALDIKTATAATATSTATFATGANKTVAFAAGDPIFSVFSNISRTNDILIDSQQLFLTQLLGVGFGENMQAQGAYNSAFLGTYQLQASATGHLQTIAANSAYFSQMASNAATTAANTGNINHTTADDYLKAIRDYASNLRGIYTESYNTNYNWFNNALRVKFDRYGYTGGVYAHGGAFTNSVVSTPTSFDMGLMGEAGPEAIMPLVNIGGNLGVRSAGGNGRDMARLEALVERLTKEVEGLRAESRATAVNTGNAAKDIRGFRDRGMTVKTDADTPLQVEVIA